MPRVAITGQKGGIGKTAIGLNLSAALAEDKRISFVSLAQFIEDKKTQYAKQIAILFPDLPARLRALAERIKQAEETVLAIDLDPQGHLTEGCGVKGLYTKDGPSLHEALIDGRTHAGDLIQAIPHEKFFLIPAHVRMLTETEQTLQNQRARERKLNTLLKDLGDAFTWELIDCPPFLGNLTDNAIFATARSAGEQRDGHKPKNGIIIPVLADKQSIRSMELLMDQVQTIEEQLEVIIERLAIVPNVITDSTFERDLMKSVRASLSITLPFDIRKRVVVKEAYNAGRSIFTYERKDKKEEIDETRNMYRLLAFDLRQRCNYV